MSSRRVTANDERNISKKLSHSVAGFLDIVKRSWPSAARVADSPILDVRYRDAFSGQRSAQMARVMQVVLGSPESSVNHHHCFRARGSLRFE
jgi:hypothetical protein